MTIGCDDVSQKNQHSGGRYYTIRYIDIETTFRYFRYVDASLLCEMYRPVGDDDEDEQCATDRVTAQIYRVAQISKLLTQYNSLIF